MPNEPKDPQPARFRCSRCREIKPAEAYNTCDVKRDTYCRPCRAAYHHEHYLRHRARYVDKAHQRTLAIAEERTAYLLDYFSAHPYVDCGESDPRVLEFDHRGDKSFNISTGIRTRPWPAVLAEIDKCDVRCANCHRRRTAERGGWFRAVLFANLPPDSPENPGEMESGRRGSNPR